MTMTDATGGNDKEKRCLPQGSITGIVKECVAACTVLLASGRKANSKARRI